MDRHSLTFVDLFDHDFEYSETYLDSLMKKAAPAWKDISEPDRWVEEVRGGEHV